MSHDAAKWKGRRQKKVALVNYPRYDNGNKLNAIVEQGANGGLVPVSVGIRGTVG